MRNLKAGDKRVEKLKVERFRRKKQIPSDGVGTCGRYARNDNFAG
jgi:hypothetical protein